MDRVEHHIEEKVILYTSLLVAVLTLAANVLNIYLKLDRILIVMITMVMVIFFSVYVYLKLKPLNAFIKYFVSIFSLLIANLTWYFNYFSLGPALGNFILVYAFIVFIWEKKKAIIFGLCIVVNLLVLMLYEYQHAEMLPQYSSPGSRVLDVYFGVALVLVAIHFFTQYLKDNYLKQYKKARKADELKTSFLANLSHEIRTPLNAIIGFSELVTEEEHSPEERKLFNAIIQSNSNDLLGLIEDVVDLALIESDDIRLVIDHFVLNDFLEKIYFEYTQINKTDKPIAIEMVPLTQKISIESDPLRVRQVIKNLFNNALKYTLEGVIRFGFNIGENEVIFFISDTGKGIKEEDQEVIFNRFMKLESASELYRGVGIGLHLSKRIARLLGGDITLESALGKGSTFYFTLPIKYHKPQSIN